MGNLIKNQTSTTKLKVKDLVETNLTKREKELLISIFSDSETFKPNQTIYKRRLNVDVRTIKRLCQSLTQKGYLTIKQLSGHNNYQWIVNDKPIIIDSVIQELDIKPIMLDKPKIDIEHLSILIGEIVNNNFPSIPEDILNEYFFKIIDNLENGNINIEDLTSLKLIKSISKFYTEPQVEEEITPTKLSIKEMEMIVNNKMNVGTKNQRDCTMNKMKDWFIQNGGVANEEEIKVQTFKTHNESKTSGRVLDQRYQD